MMTFMITSCTEKQNETEEKIEYQIDRFAEYQILRYQIPGFENLSLRQKKLAYYLSEAAKCGRDITYDQNFKYNLVIFLIAIVQILLNVQGYTIIFI